MTHTRLKPDILLRKNSMERNRFASEVMERYNAQLYSHTNTKSLHTCNQQAKESHLYVHESSCFISACSSVAAVSFRLFSLFLLVSIRCCSSPFSFFVFLTLLCCFLLNVHFSFSFSLHFLLHYTCMFSACFSLISRLFHLVLFGSNRLELFIFIWTHF